MLFPWTLTHKIDIDPRRIGTRILRSHSLRPTPSAQLRTSAAVSNASSTLQPAWAIFISIIRPHARRGSASAPPPPGARRRCHLVVTLLPGKIVKYMYSEEYEILRKPHSCLFPSRFPRLSHVPSSNAFDVTPNNEVNGQQLRTHPGSPKRPFIGESH